MLVDEFGNNLNKNVSFSLDDDFNKWQQNTLKPDVRAAWEHQQEQIDKWIVVNSKAKEVIINLKETLLSLKDFHESSLVDMSKLEQENMILKEGLNHGKETIS